MKQSAAQYLSAGLSVIPVAIDGSKSPHKNAGLWRRFIDERPTTPQIDRMFREPSGIAVIGGEVSGGLEIIDFDRAGAFDAWAELLECIAPGLLERLPVVATPNGHHVYLRSPCCEGNQKLAMSLVASEGKKSSVVIETRGRGGYVLAPPSPNACHPSGKIYAHTQGPPLTEIPTLTAEERATLFDAARSFNEVPEHAEPALPHATTASGAGRPGDDFAEKTSWHEILLPHGWRVVREIGSVTHWQRPGKDDKGLSATTGFTGDKIYVFSSNAQPFESQRAYGKFSAYAWLNHAGNFTAASKELKAKGFGEQRAPAKARSFAELEVPLPCDDDAPPDVDHGMTAAQLEPLLDDDKAAALCEPTFSRLLATRDNQAEWQRVLVLLSRHKVQRVFTEAVKKHDKAEKRGAFQLEEWKQKLLFKENKDGEQFLENCLTNVCLILTHDSAWEGVIAFDSFSMQIATRKPPPFVRHSRQWSDEDALEIKRWIEENYALRPQIALVHEAILLTAKRASFNPLVDYLDSLPDQDGQFAIDTWLIDCFGAPDTPYVRTVGRKWMISAVARAYEPGCKVDTALILEGDPGLKKSMALQQLCPESRWFADGLNELGSKAQSEDIEGKWIIELGEMKGINKDIEQTKSFMSRQAENYRPAYGRYSINSPRKCVFGGTINPGNLGYLKDETGNRRFWPVRCSKEATNITPSLRDQLWSEARTLYRLGKEQNTDYLWWLTPSENRAAMLEQSERVLLDPWHERIENHLLGKVEVTASDIFGDCLRLEIGKWNNADQQRIGRVLMACGWTRQRVREGSRFRSVYKPNPGLWNTTDGRPLELS